MHNIFLFSMNGLEFSINKRMALTPMSSQARWNGVDFGGNEWALDLDKLKPIIEKYSVVFCDFSSGISSA